MNAPTLHRALLVAVASAVVAAGCATAPEEDPVLIKLDELDRRVGAIERVMRNESLLQLAGEIEALRNEVREMRGYIEALQYESESAATRQRDQYLDLDQRLQSLERGTGALPTPGSPGVGGQIQGGGGAAGLQVPGGDDRENYQAALELLKQGRYAQAEAAFQGFLANYPQSDLADNAQYWLGEAHYVNREFEKALAAFQAVLDQYPDSRKLPDAMLKVGFCQHELKRLDEAQATLQQVVERFPDTTAARLAQQRLERIGA